MEEPKWRTKRKEMAEPMCLDCLRRRIQSDFSDRLVVCHALSNSAFPLSSAAVVQVQFLFLSLSLSKSTCIYKYICTYSRWCTNFWNFWSFADVQFKWGSFTFSVSALLSPNSSPSLLLQLRVYLLLSPFFFPFNSYLFFYNMFPSCFLEPVRFAIWKWITWN